MLKGTHHHNFYGAILCKTHITPRLAGLFGHPKKRTTGRWRERDAFHDITIQLFVGEVPEQLQHYHYLLFQRRFRFSFFVFCKLVWWSLLFKSLLAWTLLAPLFRSSSPNWSKSWSQTRDTIIFRGLIPKFCLWIHLLMKYRGPLSKTQSRASAVKCSRHSLFCRTIRLDLCSWTRESHQLSPPRTPAALLGIDLLLVY